VRARVLGTLAVAGFLALPVIGVDDYYLHLLIMAGIFFMLAAGMNLLLAGGQLNLGHTAFFGIGAYASGLLAIHWALPPLLAMVVASALSGPGTSWGASPSGCAGRTSCWSRWASPR
jgi:branched-chain amino acid transport system permease protein